MHFNKDIILNAGRGREFEILRDVAGISADLLDGKHHACPKCGGKDRFRLIDKDAGAVFCNQCFNEQNGDYIAAVQWMKDCSFDEALSLIGEYLGLTDTGTHPAKSAQAQTRGTKTGAMRERAGRVETPAKGEAKLKLAAAYDYTDGNGNQTYRVERYEDTVDGSRRKQFRQLTFLNGEWRGGLFDTPGAEIGTPKRIPYPYHYPRLISDEVKTVFIVEGEKCVERLQEVLDTVEQPGQYAVSTLAGGSKKMKFWGDHAQTLDGLKVYILPDNDKPGRDGASAAVESLDENGIKTTVIPFEDKPQKYDIADWIDEHRAAGKTDREIGEEFLKTFPAKGKDGIEWVDELVESDGKPENEPDFLEYLPKFFKGYCEGVGKAVGFDGAVAAYVGLSVASVAMAHQTVFAHGRFKAKPAILHTMVVAPSGSGKSPVFIDYMLPPLIEIHKDEIDSIYKEREEKIEKAATEKERKKLQETPIQAIKILIENPTIEAILNNFGLMEKAARKGEQKRGVCFFSDEGDQLLDGLDAYHGKAKQDLSILLSLMDGRGTGAARVDAEKDRFFTDPRLVVITGVQNKVIKKRVIGKPEYFDKGFFQRINVVVPKLFPTDYELQELNELNDGFDVLMEEYGNRIREIYDKKHYHRFYILDREAQEKYRNYIREIQAQLNGIKAQGVENFSETDAISFSLLNKSRQRVLEAALVFQVLLDVDAKKEITEANDTKGKITARAIEGAIRFVRHSHREFQKLIDLSNESNEQNLDSKIVSAVEKAGSRGITRRELRRKYFPGHGKTKADVVGDYMTGLMKRYPEIKEGVRSGRGTKSIYYYTETA